MTVPAEVLNAVLKLPVDVQEELVHELAARRMQAESLHPEWGPEIERRLDQIRAGEVETIPLSDIEVELAERRAQQNG